jgi:hypothetical protein
VVATNEGTVTEKSVRYLWGLAIWEAVVFSSIAIVFRHADRELRTEDIKLLAPAAIFGILLVKVCCSVATRVGPAMSILLGTVIGVVFIIAGGFLWGLVSRGFEVPSALLIGSFMLSIPSGIGGGIAGWLTHRR